MHTFRGPCVDADDQGFLSTNEFLQSAGGPPEVFAVGDVASSVVYPRPKAGVFAVRAGPAVAENIRRLLSGQPLQPHVPQSTYLQLITTGGRYAVGMKGWATFEGEPWGGGGQQQMTDDAGYGAACSSPWLPCRRQDGSRAQEPMVPARTRGVARGRSCGSACLHACVRAQASGPGS